MEATEGLARRERRVAGRIAGVVLIAIGVVLVAVFGFNLLGGFGEKANGVTVALDVGSTAPNFTLRDIHGEQIALADTRGKKVLINFWATWCGPCQLEMPFLQALYEAHPDDVVILAVNFDEPPEAVAAFANDFGLEFPILLDPGAIVQEVYEIRAYPSTYFVDEEGVIRAVRIGVLTEDLLDQYMAELGL